MHHMLNSHFTLGLKPFHKSPDLTTIHTIQTWSPCSAHSIFGQWALEVSPWCEFECDRGSRQSLFRRSRCCLLRAGRRGEGRAEMARRREIPQICRKPRKLDCKPDCWPQQHLIMGWVFVRLCPKSQTVWDSQSTSARANRLDCCDTWW